MVTHDLPPSNLIPRPGIVAECSGLKRNRSLLLWLSVKQHNSTMTAMALLYADNNVVCIEQGRYLIKMFLMPHAVLFVNGNVCKNRVILYMHGTK